MVNSTIIVRRRHLRDMKHKGCIWKLDLNSSLAASKVVNCKLLSFIDAVIIICRVNISECNLLYFAIV